LPLLPPATTAVLGSYLSSLYSLLTLYRRCGLDYPYDRRGFVGAKKKTSVGLLVFNPLWSPCKDDGAHFFEKVLKWFLAISLVAVSVQLCK
jgi:hypothetical protein